MKSGLELKTERLKLRPLQQSDAKAMWPYCSKVDFPKHMTWSAHCDIEQTNTYIRTVESEVKQGKSLIWAIFLKDKFAGVIGFHDIQWKIGACETGVAELGYWLNTELWGKSIMPEAALTVMMYGFDQLKLHKIKTGHVSENKQSQRVIKKLGFRFIGEEKERWKKDGVWFNHKNYELLKKEFKKAT